MSHRQQQDFCESVRRLHPRLFHNKAVLDVGSMDVNGNNRSLFMGGSYLGCDVSKGKNVNIVGKVQSVKGSFDVIISTEMLEHDDGWEDSLATMAAKVRVGGLLILTCAGPGRAEHGTRKCPHRDMGESTSDYYRNLDPSDILSVLKKTPWVIYSVTYSTDNYDTYFYGVKA